MAANTAGRRLPKFGHTKPKSRPPDYFRLELRHLPCHFPAVMRTRWPNHGSHKPKWRVGVRALYRATLKQASLAWVWVNIERGARWGHCRCRSSMAGWISKYEGIQMQLKGGADTHPISGQSHLWSVQGISHSLSPPLLTGERRAEAVAEALWLVRRTLV